MRLFTRHVRRRDYFSIVTSFRIWSASANALIALEGAQAFCMSIFDRVEHLRAICTVLA